MTSSRTQSQIQGNHPTAMELLLSLPKADRQTCKQFLKAKVLSAEKKNKTTFLRIAAVASSMFNKADRKFWLAQKIRNNKKTKLSIQTPPPSPADDSTSIDPQRSDQTIEETEIRTDTLSMLEDICQFFQQFSVEIHNDPDIIIQGKKKKKPEIEEEKKQPNPESQKRKQRRIVASAKLDAAFSERGFQKVEDHSKSFRSYTKEFPAELQEGIRNYLAEIVHDNAYDALQGLTTTDIEDVKERERIMKQRASLMEDVEYNFEKSQNLLMKQVKAVEKTLMGFHNLKFNYRVVIDGREIIQPTLVDLINNLREYLRRYDAEPPGDVGRAQRVEDRRKRIASEIQSTEFIFLLANKPIPPVTIEGRFLEYIVKTSWYVINPSTKHHCVADCLAILQSYRSDMQLTSLWGYVKKTGDSIAKKHDICKGANIEKLQELAEEYKIDVVFDPEEDREDWDCDAYFVVSNGHCVIALNPTNPRSKLIYDLSERFNIQKQQLMTAWKPKYKFVYPASYDFEWLRNGENQIPYAFGIFHTQTIYRECLGHEDIYNRFLTELYNTSAYIYEHEFIPDFENKKSESKSIVGKNKNHKNTDCIVNIFAHNGHKADYPMVVKALLNSDLFQLTGQCQSGQSKISYTYQVLGDFADYKLFVQFTDTINLYADSLENFGKAMDLPIQKQEADHNIINLSNYKTEIVRQNLAYYLRCDCEVLYKAFVKYDAILTQELGWSILKNCVFTNASMAEKIFFGSFYENNIYTMPEYMSAFCQKAYKGGLTDIFYTGTFDRVISADINSSYPFQMTKEPLPIGKSFFQTLNRQYKGEPLLEGIYRILIISTPISVKYPCLCTKIEGKLQFALFQKNYEMSITKEELVYAHQQGYTIHLLDACVCNYSAKIYDKYIFEAYEKRQEYKKLAKAALKAGDMQTYCTYDIKQTIEKTKLNSTYGKLAWAGEHDVTNFITSDSDFLLKQFALGNVNSISQINERYSSYSGKQDSSTSHTNFMLASYITARARLQLIEALTKFDLAGYNPLYSDTDSIYAQITDKATPELFQQHIQPLLHDNRLGAMKLEMSDNVGEEEAIGSFVSLKLYALKGPNTGQEKIVARGVMKWMIGNEDRNIKRRSDEGANEVTYADLAGIIQGIPIEITRQQTFIDNKKLKTDDPNIKRQKETTSIIKGTISKKVVSESGRCVPITHYGTIEFPFEKFYGEDKWLLFRKIEHIERHFDSPFDEIASKYCVFWNFVNQDFHVFLDESSIAPFLEKNNPSNNPQFVQKFGQWIIPTFDIDFVPQEHPAAKVNVDIEFAKTAIATKLGIPPESFCVVDRSRINKHGKFKHSFHLRAPDYCIQRLELSDLSRKLVLADSANEDTTTLLTFIDLSIYMAKGGLRLTDNRHYYRTNLLQISYQSPEYIKKNQKIDDSYKHKLSKGSLENFKQIAQEYMEKNDIKGWEFRNAKVCKTETFVYFNRTHQAAKHCSICERDHDKDNTLYLRMTAKHIQVCCIKNRTK